MTTYGEVAPLPGLDFTWRQFVQACQHERTPATQAAPSAWTLGTLDRLRRRCEGNRLHGYVTGDKEPGPCWYCAHPFEHQLRGKRPQAVANLAALSAEEVADRAREREKKRRQRARQQGADQSVA